MRSLFFIFCLSSSLAFAQNEEVEVKSKVREVVLYPNGVQETRLAKVNIPSGNSILKFTRLPNNINPNSIQVKGVNSFTILSVNYNQNYVLNEEEDPALTRLNDSLRELQEQADFLNQMINVLNEEKNMFRANRKLVNNKGLIVDDLKEISEYVADRIHAIDLSLIHLSKDNQELQEKIKAVNNQLIIEKNGRNKATGEISVNISSKLKSSGDVQLTYLTFNAGWSPFYDIRANEVGGPVAVSYKAHVYQQTGNDWENVKLTLSTSQPHISNSKPVIPVWYIDFYYPGRYDYYNGNNVNAVSNTVFAVEEKAKEVSNGTYSWNTPVNTINQTAINTQFEISSPYSIPSDGVQYVVEIGAYEFKADYSYSSVPKMAEDAFLLAGITNWYGYSFLPASSNIYYKGTYVGKSYLNTATTKDTLELSMGVDESVIIQRKNISDVASKSITGGSKKQEEKFEISIRNTKSVAIEILVEDQVPVSKQKEITVDVTETSEAVYDKDSGKLKWKIKLEPGETKKINFSYTVKYPKNFVIDNL